MNMTSVKQCDWTERVEAYHDGEPTHGAGVAEHVAACGDCRAYLGVLQQVSAGVAAVKPEVEIADAQFRVFMEGIEQGIAAKRAGWSMVFSRLSLLAAGLVLVVALTSIFSSAPVRAWAATWLSPTVEVHDGGGVEPGDQNPATKGNL